MSAAWPGRPQRRAQDARDRASASRSTSTGPGRASIDTPLPFLSHMLEQIARHGAFDLDGRGHGRRRDRRPPHDRGPRHRARQGRARRRSAIARASAATARRRCRWTRRWSRRRSICPGGPSSSGACRCRRRSSASGTSSSRRCSSRPSRARRRPTCTSSCTRARTCTTSSRSRFKAFARALREAVELDPRASGVPSTKGTLSRDEPCRSSSSTSGSATCAPCKGARDRGAEAAGSRSYAAHDPGARAARRPRRRPRTGRLPRLCAGACRRTARSRGPARASGAARPTSGSASACRCCSRRATRRPARPGSAGFPGKVQRLSGGAGLKIPHMGWNQLETRHRGPSPDLASRRRRRLVLLRALLPRGPRATRRCSRRPSTYGPNRVTAAVGRDNVFATQFHPEKSQENGPRAAAEPSLRTPDRGGTGEAMEVIPAIDLLDGQGGPAAPGALRRGHRLRRQSARAARRAGAGASGDSTSSTSTARAAGRAGPTASSCGDRGRAFGAGVQVGGGVRTIAAVDGYFALGVERVVLGTAAVRDPQIWSRTRPRPTPGASIVARRRARRHRRDRRLARPVRAAARSTWCESSPICRLAAVLYTDIDRDGTEVGPNVSRDRPGRSRRRAARDRQRWRRHARSPAPLAAAARASSARSSDERFTRSASRSRKPPRRPFLARRADDGRRARAPRPDRRAFTRGDLRRAPGARDRQR